MTMTLKYDFAADKSLVAQVGPTLGYTRASSATYVDSSGVIQTALTNIGRFSHIPNGTNESIGMLVERAVTNTCDHGTAMGSWGLVRGVLTGGKSTVDGTTDGYELKDDNAGGASTTYSNRNAVSVTASKSYCFSIFLKAGLSNIAYVGLVSFTTPANSFMWADLNAGTLGTVDAGFDDSDIEEWPDGWYRISGTFTTDATDVLGEVRYGVCDADGSTVVTRDGTHSVYAYGGQMELGIKPTSLIHVPTSTSVTRATEVPKTTDVSWFNPVEGTFVCEMYIEKHSLNESSRYLYAISVGATNNDTSTLRSSATNKVAAYIRSSSVDRAVAAVTTAVTPPLTAVSALGYAENDVDHWFNGFTKADNTVTPLPTGQDTFHIGQAYNGAAGVMRVHFKSLRYYDVKLTDQELEDASNGIFPAEAAADTAPFFITLGRRTAKQMRPKQRMAKPTRGLFR